MASIWMNMWNQMPKGMRTLVWIGLGVIMLVVLALLFGWVVQFLWNATVADMFGWPVISYWQAIGIFLLAKFLFGFGFGGASNSATRKKKVKKESVDKTPVDAEPGSEDLSDLPDDEDFKKFWAAEGKDAWNAFRRRA